MSIRLCCVIFGLSMLAAGPLSAQAASRPEPLLDDWRWTHFSTKEGLPSSDVVAFTEDVDGVPWVLTSGGLAWFDGFSWRALDEDLATPSRDMRALHADPCGGVIVLARRGVFRADENGSTRVVVEHEGRPLIVRSIAPWSRDSLLVGTSNGVYHVSDGNAVLDPQLGSASTRLFFDRGRAWSILNDELLEWNGRTWERLVTMTGPLVGSFVVGTESEAAFHAHGQSESGVWQIDVDGRAVFRPGGRACTHARWIRRRWRTRS